jgi:hypothetical protein
MKTNWKTINPVTQNILTWNKVHNIFQLRNRVRRALKGSEHARKLLERHSDDKKTQYKGNPILEIIRKNVLQAAGAHLKGCNQTLGGAMYYLGNHNIPIEGEPTPTPYRNTPHVTRRSSVEHIQAAA